MRRLIKYLVRIAVLLGLGFIAYALLADLPPPTGDTAVVLVSPKAGG